MQTRSRRIGIGAAMLAFVGVLIMAVGNANAGKKTKAAIGEQAPNFELYDLDGQMYTLKQFAGEGHVVVLEWFNPNCPYVQKHHKHNQTMIDLAATYSGNGVVWLAINSGAKGGESTGNARNRTAASEFNMEYPILLDEDGEVGKMYGAKTTPGMFVIDAQGVLRYAGAIDNNSSARTLGDVNYVKDALDAVLAGSEVAVPETRSYGCSVKY